MRIGVSFGDSFIDLLEFIKVTLFSQESWSQVMEKDFSIISMLLLLHVLDDLKEFLSIQFTLLFVTLIVEKGTAVCKLTLRNVRSVNILEPEGLFVLIIWKTCLTLEFSELINI